MQALCQTLEKTCQPAVALVFGDGTRILVRPTSGRLLGLYPPGSEDNFLWMNPALVSEAMTQALFDPLGYMEEWMPPLSPDLPGADFFDQSGWINPGGDRTWLAPEIDLFIEDLDRPWETYAVQRALDPGYWKLESASRSELTLTNDTRVRLHRSGLEVGARLSKNYSPAENPLQGTSLANAGLEFAGYTQITTLEQESVPGCAIRLGIWNLLQLPSPGVMLIPTCSAVQPRLVFGTLSNGECQTEPRMVRWEMETRGTNAKIALKPQSLTGRAGYFREHASDGTADLVVREFDVDPDGDYVDGLWEPPNETGWAFQACCVREGGEQFNELEYHTAAPASEASPHRDESRVWAFRGPANAIVEASAILLGTTILPLIPKANQ
jgi:hypothetical protein